MSGEFPHPDRGLSTDEGGSNLEALRYEWVREVLWAIESVRSNPGTYYCNPHPLTGEDIGPINPDNVDAVEMDLLEREPDLYEEQTVTPSEQKPTPDTINTFTEHALDRQLKVAAARRRSNTSPRLSDRGVG
jgi:hypothetical protein